MASRLRQPQSTTDKNAAILKVPSPYSSPFSSVPRALFEEKGGLNLPRLNIVSDAVGTVEKTREPCLCGLPCQYPSTMDVLEPRRLHLYSLLGNPSRNGDTYFQSQVGRFRCLDRRTDSNDGQMGQQKSQQVTPPRTRFPDAFGRLFVWTES